MLDKPMAHESVKDTFTTDSRSTGDGQKSAEELKVESNYMESKATIPERQGCREKETSL